MSCARVAALASIVMWMAVLPVGSAGAAPVTYEIVAGRYVFFPWAQSVRMLPSTLVVHRGDTLHFTSDVATTVTLLPRDQPADEWLAANHTGGGKLWSLYMPDDGGALKLNNRVLSPSRPCGWPSQPACSFDALNDAEGVLNSGLPFFDDGAGAIELRKIDFTVQVTAAAGNSFDVVSLTTPRTRMTVQVVDDSTQATDPGTLEGAAEAALVEDSAAITELDSKLASARPFIRRGRSRIWKVKAGVDTATFSLRRFYPSRSVVRAGDGIRWTFTGSMDEAYNVTFPRAKGLQVGESFPDIECNVASNDDPLGATGPSLDEPAQPAPPYCDNTAMTEFQFPRAMVAQRGDERMTRPGETASSGMRGRPLEFVKPYELRFARGLVRRRLAYIDSVHVLAGAPARGLVLVKPRNGS